MDLTEAVNVIRVFARNGTSTKMYTDANIHRVIIIIGNDFIRRTGCLKTVTTKDVAPDDATVDLTALTGFRPTLLRRAYVDQENKGDGFASVYLKDIEVIDFSAIREYRGNCNSSGTPESLAFSTWETAEIYPKAKYPCKIKFQWYTPFTTIVPGVTAGNTTLNIPEILFFEALATGGCATLQKNEPEHAAFVAQQMALYEKYINEVKKAGCMGAKVIRKQKRA